MSLQFQNMAASITGQSYYAKSIQFSEQLSAEYFTSLGMNSFSAVAATQPEGNVSISFYVTTGEEISAITGQYGRTGFVSVKAGPFSTDTALLSSFSVQGDSLGIVEASVDYTYYGQLTSGSATSIGSETIIPVHGGATLAEVQDLGVSSILSFDYSVSQTYNVQYGIGSATPQRVSFTEGERTLNLDAQTQDISFSKTSLTGVSGLCPSAIGEGGFVPKTGKVILKNLCGETVSTLDISGYLESRSFDASPGQNVNSSLTFTEKFPNSNIKVGC
tara:strand:+ start:2048 stop:2872 length:825 start_codon:yes stop_codon:yes gene_type:complete